ncbi:MAG: acyltransferase [Pseudomonadota bacterium]
MHDSVLGWAFGAASLLVALGTALIVGKLFGIESPPGRNPAIDGLRGYLAFGVFLHHATVWYFHVRTGAWGLPPPSMYRELANTCVSLFFMITAYLFIGKLLDGRRRPVDWIQLFVSRILRLTPLYLLAMVGLFVAVGTLSGWSLRVPLGALLEQVGDWVAFSMIKAPDVNGVPGTTLLMAGVTWSLAYEWLFYLSLPLLAVLLRVKVSAVLVVACTLCVVLLVINKPDAIFPTSFVKGAVAAFVSRQLRVAALLRRPGFGLLVLLAAWVAMFGHAPNAVVAVLVLAGFCVVACGNTVFGLLSNRAAIVLGDISYGVYLLHGLLLLLTFRFILGPARAAAFDPLLHWGVVTIVGMAVVVAAATTYRHVERPAMEWVNGLTSWLRSRRSTTPGKPADDASGLS